MSDWGGGRGTVGSLTRRKGRRKNTLTSPSASLCVLTCSRSPFPPQKKGPLSVSLAKKCTFAKRGKEKTTPRKGGGRGGDTFNLHLILTRSPPPLPFPSSSVCKFCGRLRPFGLFLTPFIVAFSCSREKRKRPNAKVYFITICRSPLCVCVSSYRG